jgi:hypothetical protein
MMLRRMQSILLKLTFNTIFYLKQKGPFHIETAPLLCPRLDLRSLLTDPLVNFVSLSLRLLLHYLLYNIIAKHKYH